MSEYTMDVELESWKGENAYELAVMNGYRGTLAEWLESLKGEPSNVAGPPGKDGLTTKVNGIEQVNGEITLRAGDIEMSQTDGRSVQDAMTEVTEKAEAKAVVKRFTAVLTAADWESDGAKYTQTVPVQGMLADDVVKVDLETAGVETAEEADALADGFGMLFAVESGTDSLTATCYNSTPETDLPVKMEVVR